MGKCVRKEDGGLDWDKKKADDAGITPGTVVVVVGGRVSSHSSSYLLECFGDQMFNTSMFSGSWIDHQHLMDCRYGYKTS